MKTFLRLLSCCVMFMVGHTQAGPVDDATLSRQINNVMKSLGNHSDTVMPAGDNSAVEFSICFDDQRGYGVFVPTPEKQCLTYNPEEDTLEQASGYNLVDLGQNFERLEAYFLQYQPDGNQGFWEQQLHTICYQSAQTDNPVVMTLCLNRPLVPTTTFVSSVPTIAGHKTTSSLPPSQTPSPSPSDSSEGNLASDIGGYVFVSGIVVFLVLGVGWLAWQAGVCHGLYYLCTG